MSRPNLKLRALILGLIGLAFLGWILISVLMRPRPDSDRVTNSSATTGESFETTPPSTPVSRTANPGFVGVEACRDCHEERVEDYLQTTHARTSRAAADESWGDLVPSGGMDVATRNPQVRFRVGIRDGNLVQTGFQQTPTGGEESRAEVADVIYGAGDFDEDFMYWKEDQLYQLPLVYMHSTGAWTNAPGFMDGILNFDRPVPPRCLECHATFVEHIPGTSNRYRPETAIWGISCERCHGPGQDHVAYHRSHPDDLDPHAITQPSEMTRDEKMNLCAQCHSNANKRRTHPFSYRPGDPLEVHFRIDQNNFPEEDHTSNQHRYVMESQCYQQSATLNCVTCHDPHLPADLQRRASRQACAQCHQPEACGAHDTLPEPVRDACIDCHMPKAPVNNITFDRADDQYVPHILRHEHRIAVYEDATDAVLRAWYLTQDSDEARAEAERLSETLVSRKVAEAKSLEEADRFLAAAGKIREALQLNETPALRSELERLLQMRRDLDQTMAAAVALIDQRRLPEALNLLGQVLSVKPDHAAALGKLGLVLAEVGRRDEAIDALERVAEVDPDNGYGVALLGYMHFVWKEFAKAEAYYRQAAELEPFSAKIDFYLGSVLAEQGKMDEAIEVWRRGAEIDPNNLEVLLPLSVALADRDRIDEALAVAQQAAEATGRQNATVLELLAELSARRGDWNQAVRTIREALQAVDPNDQATQQNLNQKLLRYSQQQALEGAGASSSQK